MPQNGSLRGSARVFFAVALNEVLTFPENCANAHKGVTGSYLDKHPRLEHYREVCARNNKRTQQPVRLAT